VAKPHFHESYFAELKPGASTDVRDLAVNRKTNLPSGNKGVLGPGFALVIRHQRILWWVFAANFVLGGLGASSAARALGHALHHNLAGEKLTNTFDLGIFAELVTQPDVKLFGHSGGIAVFAGIYVLFLLFATPGIVSVYMEDRRFTTGEFCQAAGSYFWAFVRLALWSLIPFILLDTLFQMVKALSDYVDERVAVDQAAFCALVIGIVPVLLLLVWVRLWFDLAQARAVSLKTRDMRRNVARTFGIAVRHAWRGYGAYLLICIFVSIATALVLLMWSRTPGRAVWLTFVLLEIIMLTHIFGRLWQKACATTWYRLNPEPVPPPPVPPPWEPYRQAPAEQASGSVQDVDAPLSAEVEAPPSEELNQSQQS